MAERRDIVIIGAALNGLATALALAGKQARRPLSVMVVDAKDPRHFATDAFDGRASAITASSQRMLEALGLWKTIEPFAQPINRIIVTDARLGAELRPSLLNFGETEAGAQPTAYMVENRELYRILLDAVIASPAISLLTDSRVARYHLDHGLARIETESGATIISALIIAAEGRASPARAAAGIKIYGWDYGQTGLVTAVGHELPHEGCAEEHFLPAGPFAILPLTGNRSSLVWTEKTAAAKVMLELDDAVFLAEIEKRFGAHRGRLSLIGSRHGYPLALFIAEEFAGPRVALLGDAAHVVHPIAGLGLNLGFRDAAALAECIAEAHRLGLDIGSETVLSNYTRWRRFDTVLTAIATDGLNWLFSNDVTALRLVRDAGLKLVDAASPLKRMFMREAAGESGRLPRLMRGEPV